MIGGHFEGSLTEKEAHNGTEEVSIKGGQSRVTIDMLPDVALLRIFDFCVDKTELSWFLLVFVCRTWRKVILGSPRRLGLRLDYDTLTPAGELDVLPLPINIQPSSHLDVGNLIAALEYNDRICEFDLFQFPKSEVNKTLEAMQRPFPLLTYLRIRPKFDRTPFDPVPASFLGGFAPRLQTLVLEWIPFPGLPSLLLSATHLVTLSLLEILPSGYISPEALVTCLSGLTRLDKLEFEFAYSFPELESPSPPPRIRTLFPALTELRLQGVSEYLEDFVARIDAPLLDDLIIIFFHQSISDTSQIAQFIGRTPNFEAYDHAQVVFSYCDTSVVFLQASIRLELRMLGSQPDEQLSSLAQVCSSSFPRALIASLEHLYLLPFEPFYDRYPGDTDITQWLDLLRPFTGVKRLYMHSEFGPYIPLALQRLVGERVTEVLPALRVLFLEIQEEEEREREEDEEEEDDDDDDDDDEDKDGEEDEDENDVEEEDKEEEEEEEEEVVVVVEEPLGVQDVIGQFVAARQLAGHPIYFYSWDESNVKYY